MATNYNELIAEVKQWTKRSGLTNVPTLITFAEKMLIHGIGDNPMDRMYLEPVRINEMISSETVTLNSGSDSLTLPSGFLGFAESPYLDGDVDYPLDPIGSTNRVMRSSASENTPTEYNIVGTTMTFNRTANQDYEIPMKFYKLDGLTASNTTNELLTKRPDIYLDAVLFQAYRFLKAMDKANEHFGYLVQACGGSSKQTQDERFFGPLVVKPDGGTP